MTNNLWTILFIFIFGNSIASSPLDSVTNQKLFLTKVFKTLVENDKQAYKSCLFSTTALKYQVTEAKGLTNISGRQEQVVDSIIQTLHQEYLITETKNYNKIQSKLIEFKIKADKVVIDSILFNSKPADKLSSGIIYFKKSDDSEFYKMNFQGVYDFNGSYYIETVFVPYIYIGPKNRRLTSNLKPAYLDTCMKLAQEFIDNYPNKQLSEAIFGKCPRCYCEKQYFNQTEETDAMDRIKNPSFGFKLPDKYKSKNNYR